ncbi:MAG: hypothetical protein ACXVAX_12100 [Pseudobdellovibrio sp.]
MNKTEILKPLIEEVTRQLKSALSAAQNTYDDATHEDNKAENKYDTRSLEASYLAGAQAERVKDLKETLSYVSQLQLKNFLGNDPIALTALIELSTGSKNTWVLLLAKGGGQSIHFYNKAVQVITPDSPIGKLLIGKRKDDDFFLNQKEYLIENVY